VDRKTFLKTALGAGAGALLAHNGPISSAVDLAGILSGPTAYYRRMESAVPSDQLTPAVDAQPEPGDRHRARAAAHGIRLSSVVRGSRLVSMARG